MNLKCLLGHSPASPATYLTEGSCEQGYTCIRCGQTITTGIVHQFGPDKASDQCHVEKTCLRCGFHEDYELEHVWIQGEMSPGYKVIRGTDYAMYYYSCARCDATKEDV